MVLVVIAVFWCCCCGYTTGPGRDTGPTAEPPPIFIKLSKKYQSKDLTAASSLFEVAEEAELCAGNPP